MRGRKGERKWDKRLREWVGEIKGRGRHTGNSEVKQQRKRREGEDSNRVDSHMDEGNNGGQSESKR